MYSRYLETNDYALKAFKMKHFSKTYFCEGEPELDRLLCCCFCCFVFGGSGFKIFNSPVFSQ